MQTLGIHSLHLEELLVWWEASRLVNNQCGKKAVYRGHPSDEGRGDGASRRYAERRDRPQTVKRTRGLGDREG